jgi:hypothetical protein
MYRYAHAPRYTYVYIYIFVYIYMYVYTHEIIIRNKHKPNVEGRQAVASLSTKQLKGK